MDRMAVAMPTRAAMGLRVATLLRIAIGANTTCAGFQPWQARFQSGYAGFNAWNTGF